MLVSSWSFLETLPSQKYNQVVWISPDDQIREYIWWQLWNNEAVLDMLDQVEEFVIAQWWDSEQPETLMIAQWEEIQTSLFNTIWMLDLTDWYQFEQVTNDIVAYGPSSLVAWLWSGKKGFEEDSLEYLLIQDKKSSWSTVWFMSRPSGNISAWLGLPLSQKMKWTLAHISFAENLIPEGTIDMYFDNGVIQEWSSERYPLISPNTKWGSLVIWNILELLGVEKSSVTAFLPFVLEQYVGDSIALLNTQDYTRIYDGLNTSVRIDMGQSDMWNSYVLTLGDEKIFETLEKVAPFVKPKLQEQIWTGTLLTNFEANKLTRTIETTQWAFPYLSIVKGAWSTSLWLFTDEFATYTLDDNAIGKDIMWKISILPSLLPVTNTLTWKSFWEWITENIEWEIALDESNNKLTIEIR